MEMAGRWVCVRDRVSLRSDLGEMRGQRVPIESWTRLSNRKRPELSLEPSVPVLIILGERMLSVSVSVAVAEAEVNKIGDTFTSECYPIWRLQASISMAIWQFVAILFSHPIADTAGLFVLILPPGPACRLPLATRSPVR